MMKSAKLLVLLTTLLAVTLPSHAQTPPKVEIFYETLNDAVRKFFIEQFKVVSDNILTQIDLRLYPYGKTVKNTDNSYTCNFNDLQCEANKIHACFIKAEILSEDPPAPITDVDKPINQTSASSFVNCFFKNRYADDDVESLGAKCLPPGAEDDWAELRACIFEEEDTVTPLFETVSLPAQTALTADGLAIKIDGDFVDAAKTNLLGAICPKLTGSAPDICSQSTTLPTKVKIGVYYEAQNTDAGKYLVKQLGTFYHVIEDFVDIELVPYGNTQLVGSTYNCTLGEAQCISNKYQALVADAYINNAKNGDPISGQNRAVNFIQCLFQSTSGSEITALQSCSNQYLEADDYRTFIEFIRLDSNELKTVFQAVKDKTDAVALSTGGSLPRVPTITVNGKVDYSALEDLVQEACVQYNGPTKASICTKTNVTVLYEALNHKSRTLFLEQLAPTFGNLYNLINLNLVPAGRAIMAPGHGFVCPAGIDQCNAMKLQACALDFYWNDGNNYTDPIRQEIFEFIKCTFKNKKLANVMDAAELCSEDYIEFDAWFTIHGCYVDGTAEALLADNIEYTQSLVADMEHHVVPTVLINGEVVTDLSTIKAQICGLYDDYHQPDYCQSDAPSKVKVQVFYESMSELSKYFFATQFDPWFIYIEEMADIQLFPAGNVRESGATDGTCDSYDANSTCLANKIQAFVIDKYSKHDDDGDYIDGTLRTMRFLACAFNHPNFKDNVYAVAEYCTEETLKDDEWFDLLTTVKSEEGNQIYSAVVQLTDQFLADNSLTSLDPVPWVTVDNQNHSKRAADDLLQTVCNLYTGEKPPECTPVLVEIYYSAINPQSRRFFIDQLMPVYRNLRERIHLDLIPFGLPNANQTIDEECAVKNNTCMANKAQACAIKKFFDDEVGENTIQWDGKNQTLSFVYCMFKNIENQKNIFALVEECANQNLIFGDEVTECAREAEGMEYLSEMKNKSLAQYESMEHAPWIVVNGLRSAFAQSDLKTAVCDAMVGDKPDFCYEPTPAKVKVEFHYSALDSNAQNYVVNELYPHYRNLEEIIDLDVVPFGLTEVLTQDDGGITLICPNGVEECEANLIHACVYSEYYKNDDDPVSDNPDEFDSKLQVIDFIKCYFVSPNYPSKIVQAATECVESTFNDAYATIKECAQSDLGPKLLAEFQETKVDRLLPHLTYVPWITVNGKHSYSVEHHIQRTVCNAYTGREKPLDCYQIYDVDAKPEVVVHYEIGDAGSKDFFTNLLPETISSIADVKMVPFGRSTNGETKKCLNDDTCIQYKEHACLLSVFYNTEPVKTLQAIACTFGDQMSDPNVVNMCVNQVFEESITDPWRLIETCILNQGDELLQANADLASSLSPKISHVPWVLIDEEHNIEAEVGLVNEVCGVYYPADKPTSCQPTLLNVAVYYETENTNVASFFLNQLSLYTEYLDELGQFAFIPYGKTTNNGDQYTCPNGPKQCHANTVHACVINRFYNRSSVNLDSEFEKNRIRTVGFIECTFFQQENGQLDPVANAEACLDMNFEGDLWRDIHYCVVGPDGVALNAEMARQTAALSPPLSSAPVVTIGGQQSQDVQKNFFQKLCDTYGNVRAPQCATLPSLAVRVGIYFSGNPAGQKYLAEQLYPFFQEVVPVRRDSSSEAKLHAVINPDLIAWGNTQYNPNATGNPFTCEGQNECYINRFFACANHYHGQEPRAQKHLLEFTLCFAKNSDALINPQSVFNNCTNRVWIPDPYTQLEICATADDQEYYDIFLKAKLKTDNNYPALTSFPAVTVNNIRDPAAESDLLSVVCNNYQGYDRPAECSIVVEPTTTTQTPPITTPQSITTGSGEITPNPTTPEPTTPGITLAPTTLAPITPETTTPGSGTTPAISIFVLFVSFIISRLLF